MKLDLIKDQILDNNTASSILERLGISPSQEKIDILESMRPMPEHGALSEFEDAVNNLIRNKIFSDPEGFVVPHDPWKRPLRPQTFKDFKFDYSNADNHLNYSAFTANRLLTALHELDFLFLPAGTLRKDAEYSTFYNSDLRKQANIAIPVLQDYALRFIDKEVNVSGNWTKEKFKDYFNSRVLPLVEDEPLSLKLTRESKYPKQAAELLLIQHALDFLVEASHMARYILGDYGEIQSQLFRVLLDEFGYGVHNTKHSTLFKKTMTSVGLHDNPHAYWQFYLNTTFLLNNYFHKITKQPEHFFKYLGAITLAENTFGPYCRRTAELLQEIYGDTVDVAYYLEHAHIDKHHGQMTYEDIVLPAIDKYGVEIIPEIVLGIEQTIYLQNMAEQDLCEQLKWMSNKDDYGLLGREILHAVLNGSENVPVAKLHEPLHELSVTHVHDGDELCYVKKGKLQFISGPNSYIELAEGQAVVIKRNRLHGALIVSDYCDYEIHSIGDYSHYANRKI